MTNILKITLIIFLSITSFNNFAFSQDVEITRGEGLAADYYPVYIDGRATYVRRGSLNMEMSTVLKSEEYEIYNPPKCGEDFYSCEEGEIGGAVRDNDNDAIWSCKKEEDIELCNKRKKDNDDNNDFCGVNVGACLSGSTLIAKNSMTNSWTCKKTYEEMKSKTQHCQKMTLPSVDGNCGVNKYSCTSGTVDIVSSTKWICRGNQTGSDMSCTYDPVINGSCGSKTDSCESGTFKMQFGSSWICKGSNGGSDANCTKPNPILNGICGSNLYTCDQGSVILKNGNDWACSGSNGGSSDYCTYEEPTAENCSGGMVDMSIIKDGKCTIYSGSLKNGESHFIGEYESGKPFGICGKCDFQGTESEMRYYTKPEVKCVDGEFKVIKTPNRHCINPF